MEFNAAVSCGEIFATSDWLQWPGETEGATHSPSLSLSFSLSLSLYPERKVEYFRNEADRGGKREREEMIITTKRKKKKEEEEEEEWEEEKVRKRGKVTREKVPFTSSQKQLVV